MITMSSTSSSLPPLYFMCSRQECQERPASIFERDENGNFDPRRAVAQYCRGEPRYPGRSSRQLQATVQYLLSLLATSKHDDLLQTVNFVQDRLRACQAERPPAWLQVYFVRCYVLCLYLLADVPEYEPKFARHALQTALDAYWNCPIDKRSHDDDELLSYALALQLAACLTTAQGHSSSSTPFGSLLGLIRTAAMGPQSRLVLQWSALAVREEYGTLLRVLWTNSAPGPLLKCCLASALPTLRYQQLHQYNVSFRKGECIQQDEVARLLCMKENPAKSIAQCVGVLPTQQSNQDENAKLLIFKSAALTKPTTSPQLRDDALCLPPDCADRLDSRGVVVLCCKVMQQLLLSGFPAKNN